MKKIISLFLFISLIAIITSGCSLSCEHSFKEANCCAPATCKLCGKIEGGFGDHSWKPATCTTPKRCILCNKTEGSASGHNWKSATCTTPKTCTICYETTGTTSDHNWKAATCTSPKTCYLCYTTSGKALDHNIVDFTCTRCNYSNIKASDVPKIIDITYIGTGQNYLGGHEPKMDIKNKSSKTIKYASFNLTYYNSVGDKLIYNGSDNFTIRIVGPLVKNQTEEYEWDAIFYSNVWHRSVSINWIKIEYMDGSTITLDSSIANDAVVSWR